MNVYSEADGKVIVEISDGTLELSQIEAEDLFVHLGHVLRDMHGTQEELTSAD